MKSHREVLNQALAQLSDDFHDEEGDLIGEKKYWEPALTADGGQRDNAWVMDGNRVAAFLTNSPRFNVAFLVARYRARGRYENRIKTLKSTGLGQLSYWSFSANQAWVDLAMFAVDLVSWLQLAVLPGGHEASVRDLERW